MEIASIIDKIKKYKPESNTDIIRKSYEFAELAHRGTKRLSGEDFIQHPLNVAYILADLKLDEKTISAALLHDVLRDPSESLETLKEKFGEEIANLVNGVTNISKLKTKSKEDCNSESIRKMLLATANDVRIILIKLADKLHNMRTLDYLPEEKQKETSKKVLEIYAPLAYRLGIERVKGELKDLAFKYLEPEKYSFLIEKVKDRYKNREEEIVGAKETLFQEFEKHNIKADITGRPKRFNSIYEKMKKKNYSFEQIYDIVALRVITKTIKNCYEILGIVHNLWKPIPGEFSDYIAMPKSNMYQSIHTIVVSNTGKLFEIQIRTEDMHLLAEDGIAAHWSYKGESGDKVFDKKLSWLKELLGWQQDSESPKEFINGLKLGFFENEIFVFTPKGKVIELPKRSVVIDFAYAIHSSIGDKCGGARINGKFASLRTELKNGDIVEILTGKKHTPSRTWLKFARTARAKSKIKQAVRLKQNIPIKSIEIKEPLKEIKKDLIKIKNVEDATIKYSKCCNPLPGEEIVGFITKSKRLHIHKFDCKSINNSVNKKKIEVSWINDIDSLINIRVNASDRVGLLADILNTILLTKLKVESTQAKIAGKDITECNFSIKVDTLDNLENLIKMVKKVKGVRKISIN
ncbi:(p)ppGpp synthetase [archaeon]|nr:(p)ppGpp synthetase [archaeon]|tara:strand:- start:2112 stop:4016 length:1905 start_codon:yes stop_codon:yes gene_type:complete